MQALPWGPEFRTWKSWLGLGSPDKDLEVLISKSWIQDLFAGPTNHAWNPTIMPINVGYHALNRRLPRCSPIILTSSSPFPRPYSDSRWGNGEIWWMNLQIVKLLSKFFQEILAGKYDQWSLLTTCPRVYSTWWVIIFLLCWIFSQTISHQVGNVDEVVAKAEKLLAEAAAN